MCLPIPCDPFGQDCDDGEGCYRVENTVVCAPDRSGDAGGDGDPCRSINACDPGMVCQNAADIADCESGSGCCSPYCDLDEPTCPHPQETCLPLFGAGNAPPGKERYGVCGAEP